MPLEILGPLVIGGITLTVLVVYFSGISKVVILADVAAVQQEFLKDYGDALIEQTFLTSNNMAGFLKLRRDDSVGLVEVMGDRYITRILLPGDVVDLQQSSDRLDIRFNDFTHNEQSYTIEDENTAKAVHDLLANLTQTPNS